MTAQNPLIADTPTETLENVTEAMNALFALLANDPEKNGLCRLMTPLLHALEHAIGKDS